MRMRAGSRAPALVGALMAREGDARGYFASQASHLHFFVQGQTAERPR